MAALLSEGNGIIESFYSSHVLSLQSLLQGCEKYSVLASAVITGTQLK